MKKYMFLLSVAATMFFGCQKEALPPDPVDDGQEEPFAAPDSIHDLVGYFNSLEEIFLIDPAFLESVLEYVSATPTSDGRYQVTVVLENGELLDYFFWVKLIPAPELYFLAGELNKPVLDSEVEGGWKIYSNATCPEKPNVKKDAGKCETVNNDPDGAKSKKTEHGAYKTCIYNANPNNLCREVMGQIGTTTFYEKLNCRGEVIRTEPFNSLKCG